MSALSHATTLTIALSLVAGLVSAGCSAAPGEAFGEQESAAKIAGTRIDCFPSCDQQQYDDMTKGGIKKACEDLKAGWKKKVRKPSWPGWDDDKPICIGHRGSIEDRKDCNRLVDAPGWTECKNELMLACVKGKEPGFGPIILVPPKGGWPPAREPDPSITDQELACIKQWKCPKKRNKIAAKSVETLEPLAAAVACDVDAGPECGPCDDSWVSEEPVPTTDTPADAGTTADDAAALVLTPYPTLAN